MSYQGNSVYLNKDTTKEARDHRRKELVRLLSFPELTPREQRRLYRLRELIKRDTRIAIKELLEKRSD